MGFIIDLLILWAVFSVIVGVVNITYDYILNKFKKKYFMVTFVDSDGYTVTIYTTVKGQSYPDKQFMIEWMFSNWKMGDTLPSDLIITNIIEVPNKKAYDLINPNIIDEEILGYKPALSDEEQMAKDLVDIHEEDLIKHVQNKDEKPN